MDASFSYTLVAPISVSSGGKESLQDEVEVRGPRPRDAASALVLESILGKALTNFNAPSASDDEPSKKRSKKEEDIPLEEKIKGWELCIISGSTPENIRNIINVLRDLMCEGNKEMPQATIGKEKFTKPLFDELSHKDIKALLARYAVHFLFSDMI